MEKQNNTIHDILSLARYEGKPDRVGIFCRTFGLLLENKVDPGASVYSLLFQMMDVLWQDIGIPMRVELAKRVTAAPNPPAGLAFRFAVDEPEVASHILRDPKLDDRFLINVIARTGRAHHLLIAESVDLSEVVWKAINGARSTGKKTKAVMKNQAPAISESDESLFSLELGKDKPVRVRVSDQENGALKKPVPMVEAFVTAAMEDVVGPIEVSEKEPDKRQEEPLSWSWKTDRSGAILEIDEACCTAFGMGRDQLMGRNLFALVSDASDSDIKLAASVDKRTPIRNLPIEIEDNFGSATKWVLSGKASFETQGGKFEGYIGMASRGPGGE
jgi:hypothetical protein